MSSYCSSLLFEAKRSVSSHSEIMDFSKPKTPAILNLNADNITQNTIAINSRNPDPRSKFLLDRAVKHLHDFARETRLSTKEWMAVIEFLTAVGKMCSDVRQEFILLSDVLGLSLLVDSIDHPKPEAATEGTALGPFHVDHTPVVDSGASISQDSAGSPLLVLCNIRDTNGQPVEGVKIDVWETDSSGFYDVQHTDYNGPDGRCVLYSDKSGKFWFKAIKPVSYPIPHDGPVEALLQKLHRHPYRPAHMHFMFEKGGYDNLITAVYDRQDPYIESDAVFGVKDSLIVDMTSLDEETAREYLTTEELDRVKDWSLLQYDFVLVNEVEAKELRLLQSSVALQSLGVSFDMIDGLPVPGLD